MGKLFTTEAMVRAQKTICALRSAFICKKPRRKARAVCNKLLNYSSTTGGRSAGALEADPRVALVRVVEVPLVVALVEQLLHHGLSSALREVLVVAGYHVCSWPD